MNRDGIREFAARELALITSRYKFAESRDEAMAAVDEVGLPCVVKPVMSSSGKGQTTAKSTEDVGAAWDYAVANMRGDRPRVIVEEFVEFDSEITLLTVATEGGDPVLRADRPPAGSRRLSRKLAAGRHSRRRYAFSPATGAQGCRGARRLRHFRGRILHPRRPGDLLGIVAAAARYGHGHTHHAIPERVRIAPARGSPPADSGDRADPSGRVGGDPRGSRERGLRIRGDRRRASGAAIRGRRSTSACSASRTR